MDRDSEGLIGRHTFDLSALMTEHPPQFRHANKQIVYQIACPPGTTYTGQLVFSRWRPMVLPQAFTPAPHQTQIEERQGYFGYEPSPEPTAIEWYLNFADPDLFAFYSGGLFAQDEMQVAEHPALAALREALLANRIQIGTVEDDQPTPILVRGVERRCAIATNPNPAQGRPLGLYGNRFASANAAAIQQATTPLQPPTISNILAIAAPSGGYGMYRRHQIDYILTTAVTGFTAVRLESQLVTPTPAAIVIHTGYWGCGAFGGNRVLMALVQLLAARLSQIDRLVFHTSDPAGSADLAKARQILEHDLLADAASVSVSDLIDAIVAMKFQWGVSDGN
ncbi:hypothetical protein [Pantanalinema sp. GBBB05]|uniref:hypothetical protein n=1 Tax=Pantanalinema sp. GBBB05 TaxID=2604139 RepID=UPI001DE36609|nr:hypothetical protein [Pantanalinema sp. GBBB05]